MLVYFSSFNNCTINSKFMDLACHVSFQVFILKNFFLVIFTHFVTNSISSLCLVVVVVVTTPSCQTTIDFISSITRANVLSMILKFCCKVAKIPHLLLLCLALLQLLLSLMDFLVQLHFNNNKSGIIPFPFLPMGFKIQRINVLFRMFLFMHDYSLQTFHF